MADVELLPGFGNAYISEQFSSTVNGVDRIDAMRAAELAVQVTQVSGSPTGNLQLQQRFDLSANNWANLGGAINVATNGVILLLGIASGPFGQIRITSTVTGGTVYATIVGAPLTPIW